jgi:hypothetical protein
LSNIEFPARLYVLLPNEIHELTSEIIFQLAWLRVNCSFSNPKMDKSANDWVRNLKTAHDQVEEIRGMKDNLKAKLVEEYKKTFN